MASGERALERNLDGYGAPTIDWAPVRNVLDGALTQAPGTGGPERHTAWLASINPDGSPHVMPLGVISVATHPYDIVVEGTAQQVTDPAELQAVADAFAAQGWPASVAGDALTAEFSAPSAGPPPWNVYRLIQSTVYALGTAEPYGATRFDLVPSGGG